MIQLICKKKYSIHLKFRNLFLIFLVINDSNHFYKEIFNSFESKKFVLFTLKIKKKLLKLFTLVVKTTKLVKKLFRVKNSN